MRIEKAGNCFATGCRELPRREELFFIGLLLLEQG
jgi:hypothetical protein